ncbi:MAG: RNHCP domain-containing protein [Candidatus Dojkabacteria bacterium]|nr:MAG: RNHCP domain-containing protein [Candidatus Dojkabacteria bacterium]
MGNRKFVKNNESFRCVNCGVDVPVHPSSSRDHCNQCLYSLHVDINPGDRANPCKGILKPIAVLQSNNRQQIEYECEKCGATVRNIVAPDDDMNRLIEVSVQPWEGSTASK